MKRIVDPSLSRSVVLHLIVAQLVAFFIGAIVTMGLELGHIAYFGLPPDDLAVDRVNSLIVDSLVLGGDFRPHIEPTAQLRAEVSRTPKLKFAVFDEDRRPVRGSSPDLVETLTKAGVIQISTAHIHFNLPGDAETIPVGHMELRKTPFGRLHVAVYRAKFIWQDILIGFVADEFKGNVAYVASAILVSTATAWFAVRRGLRPLRSAAQLVEGLDFNSLDRGVAVQDIPNEIWPFIDAINAALARLDASAKRMRRYTANVAHELRTPLAIMRARIQNAEESDFKHEIEQDASQLQSIVEQILAVSRVGEKQAPLDEEIDLVDAALSVVAGRTPLVVKTDRRIEFEADEAPIRIKGSRRALESVIANLIDNAIRAEPPGGTITARVGPDATVTIVDHGEGVAQSDRELVFDPFWRKAETSAGAGLGLAIAKELTEAMGGRIWIEDTPRGGATFKLSFPRMA